MSVSSRADEPELCYEVPTYTWQLDQQDKHKLLNSPATLIFSDEFQGIANKKYSFMGNIQAHRQNNKFSSDHATYDLESEQLELEGNVHLDFEGLLVDGDRAAWNFKLEKGEAENIKYWFPKTRVAGEAALAHIENRNTSRFKSASYTSCNLKRPFWRLRAKRIGLYADKNTGEASHVILDIKNIPVLYLPYINFPLSGRKSGLLAPGLNHSKRLGFTVAVPFYWNIAPHRDATFTLRQTQERGPQVSGQFRYLNPNNSGQLDGVVLVYKDPPGDEERGVRRYYYSLKHTANPFAHWRFNLDYKQVSDDQYFTDFGKSLSSTNIVNLPQTADAVYVGQHTRITTRWLKYQSLANNIQPYEKLPEMALHFDYPKALYKIKFNADLNVTRFTHKEKASGNRFYVIPKVTLPFESTAGFLRFNASVHHTRYSLTGQQQQIDPTANRTVPVYSVGSGVFLERDLLWGGKRFLQTLEPQLFYVYIPMSQSQVNAQSAIHVFEDTTVSPLTYSGLLSEYRFTGPDRIGDANHIAMTLTNRIIDEKGKERITLNLGQLFYLADRKVTLDQSVETNGLSDTFMDFRTHAKEWQINSNMQWNNARQNLSLGRFQVRYKSSNQNLVNFGFFFERDSANNVLKNNADLAFFWDIHSKWNFVGRYIYSFNDKLAKEVLAGLEYKDCCWAVRFGSQFYRDDADNNNWKAFPFFQLELKGLTSIGEDFNKLLNDNLYGAFGN